MILQYKKSDDWVIATNKDNTVKNFVNTTAKKLSIDIVWKGSGIKEKAIEKKTGKTIIDIDPKYASDTFPFGVVYCSHLLDG